ncbi:hypothetical protein [Saccharopolyspora gregorii]|uniref:DUF222 domain-containing protein n=1 Tax=Saccharopolyspora gregorii TaxID=33914 RepID=A0ABP6S2S1_9PSEU
MGPGVLGADAATTYDAAARALGLRTLDDRVLRLVDAIGVLRSVACLALAPQLPMLAEAVAPCSTAGGTAPSPVASSADLARLRATGCRPSRAASTTRGRTCA